MRVTIATPCYGNMMSAPFALSVMNVLCQAPRLGFRPHFITCVDSLVPRARNRLVSMFLESNDEWLFFIDADIEFDPQAVAELLFNDHPISAALYPIKTIDWEKINQFAALPPAEMESLSHSFAGKLFEPIRQQGGLIEASFVGSGFLCVHRRVLMDLIRKEVVKPYRIDDTKRTTHDFFPTPIVEGRYLSEDYGFCHLVRSIGHSIWVDPRIRLTHYGNSPHSGRLQDRIEYKAVTERQSRA